MLINELAESLHNTTCHWNHTDGCSWYYESWENPGYARKRALAEAQRLLDRTGVSMEICKRVLDALKGVTNG